MIGDPKPGVRREIVDPAVGRLFLAAHTACVACGAPGANAHHVLERDDGGDDVPENLVTLCGSGTMRCHGAYHGNPYLVSAGWQPDGPLPAERRDAAWVARRIGEHLLAERPDVLDYLVRKLGPLRAAHYLSSRYAVTMPT